MFEIHISGSSPSVKIHAKYPILSATGLVIIMTTIFMNTKLTGDGVDDVVCPFTNNTNSTLSVCFKTSDIINSLVNDQLL